MDLNFELAIDHLLSGSLDELLLLLISNESKIIHSTSAFGHRASLIHYLGSNGVEMWRQVVPLNCIELLTFLVNSGSDPNALMNVYNGQYELKSLISSSAHPRRIGLDKKMIAILDRS